MARKKMNKLCFIRILYYLTYTDGCTLNIQLKRIYFKGVSKMEFNTPQAIRKIKLSPKSTILINGKNQCKLQAMSFALKYHKIDVIAIMTDIARNVSKKSNCGSI